MHISNFETTLLPRLVATYEAGRLVPFIGSGMSRLACADWPTFIRQLEAAAGLAGAPPVDDQTPREELIRRANVAVRLLRGGEPGAFEKAVRECLLTAKVDNLLIPSQTISLARMWWPLVLSTNYDNCYAAAVHKHDPQRQLAIVGRSAEDCQRVLTSFTTAGRPLLWALQGYLHDVPHARLPFDAKPELEQQLVVGHEEYRRVTYRDLHFRRAFAEVFRQRSLLFVGAGIQESYLQELFGEVLEFYGPGTRPHYALIQEGEVDADFMLSRFQIMVVEYKKGDHPEVVRSLNSLADATMSPTRTQVAWSWGRINRRDENDWSSLPDLEVVRGPLPRKWAKGECLAVSAGGSGSQFFFSEGIRQVMKGWGVTVTEKGIEPDKFTEPYLGEFADSDVYGVRARAEGEDVRSLADIYNASLALFEHLAGRYRRIRMQLLATGGTDKRGVPKQKWQVRSYPERFSFIQTVRAWAEWRKENPLADTRLILHVVLHSVYQDIASGRIDVLELLSCDDIRFFVEVISEAGEVERRLFQAMPDVTLGSVVDDLQLSAAHWKVEVTPPPGLKSRPMKLSARRLKQTLQTLGVVPGSTLHFRRVNGQH